MTKRQKQVAEARAQLTGNIAAPLVPGAVVFFVVRKRSREGLNRQVEFFQVVELGNGQQAFNLTYHIARLLGLRYGEHDAGMHTDDDPRALIEQYVSHALFGAGGKLRAERI